MTARWFALRDAATVLGLSAEALRKKLERSNPCLGADGVLEARLDGVVARKFGGCWRVALGAGWTEPSVLESRRQVRDRRGRGEPQP